EILAAQPVECLLLLSLVVDSDFIYAKVEEQVRDALLDPEAGLFGAVRLGIGKAIFESEVMDACLHIPGMKAVHDFLFIDEIGSSGPRFDPGEGGYYLLKNDYLWIWSGARYV